MEDVDITEENKEPTPTLNEAGMCNANFRDVTILSILLYFAVQKCLDFVVDV